MNKKSIFGFLCIILLLLLVLGGCKDPLSETMYLVRTGVQSAGSDYFEIGTSVSPNGSLVPYLVEDNRSTASLSEVESMFTQLGFDQSWIQPVKNYLNSNGSAFVFYTNRSNDYRWIWITEN